MEQLRDRHGGAKAVFQQHTGTDNVTPSHAPATATATNPETSDRRPPNHHVTESTSAKRVNNHQAAAREQENSGTGGNRSFSDLSSWEKLSLALLQRLRKSRGSDWAKIKCWQTSVISARFRKNQDRISHSQRRPYRFNSWWLMIQYQPNRDESRPRLSCQMADYEVSSAKFQALKKDEIQILKAWHKGIQTNHNERTTNFNPLQFSTEHAQLTHINAQAPSHQFIASLCQFLCSVCLLRIMWNCLKMRQKSKGIQKGSAGGMVPAGAPSLI